MDNRIWMSKPGRSGGTILDYYNKWGMPYRLGPNWDKIGRSGDSGYDAVLGIIAHHDAIRAGAGNTWSSSIPPRWGGNRTDGPVGAGTLEHDGFIQLWAAGATNCAGKGGPLLGSRGVIALDNGNRTTVSYEARNDGVGGPWTPAQIANYPLLMAATLDWANHETPGAPLGAGDVWYHAIYAKGRKIDPATVDGAPPYGPAVNSSGTWSVDPFRAPVFALLMAGPGGGPTPAPPEEDDDVNFTAQRQDGSLLLINSSCTAARFITQDEYNTFAARGVGDARTEFGHRLVDSVPVVA